MKTRRLFPILTYVIICLVCASTGTAGQGIERINNDFSMGKKFFVEGEYDNAIRVLDMLRRRLITARSEDENWFDQRATKVISYSYLYKYMKDKDDHNLKMAEKYMTMACEKGDSWSCEENKVGIIYEARKSNFFKQDLQVTLRNDGVLLLGNRVISTDMTVFLLSKELQEIIGKNPNAIVLVNNDIYFDGRCLRDVVIYSPGEGLMEEGSYCDVLRKSYKP